MKRLHLFGIMAVILLASFSVSALAGDKPDFDVQWYGYFKLDGAYDQNLTSHGNFALWVKPQSLDKDDAQFNMTANQTRLGLKATGTGYGEYKVNGKLEFDLYGGVSGATVAQNKAMLQLRHAYFTLEKGNMKLLAGQSWDLISPLNASTLNYPVLWGCGNFGYRRPQISLFYTAPAGDNTKVIMSGGLFRTIGTDLTPTFSLATGEGSEGSDDGTDAAIPSFQGRFDVQHKSATGTAVRAGFSGLWGQLRAETNLGNYETYESWAANGFLQFNHSSGFGFNGEFYTGSNLSSYFGAILNGSTIEGVNSTGGYGSMWFKASKNVKFTTGAGVDKVKNEDIGSGARSQNRCVFGNVKYAIVSYVTLGLEVSSWETQYKDGEAASNLRVQTSFILNF
ncbi:MAG: hypothetical protein KAR42_03515 [candidate division Zixibacteria bacterium]|nr:hypothetical protein [candidate division Zixibacteria bacterium]